MGIYPYDSTMAALALLELKALVGVLVVIRELIIWQLIMNSSISIKASLALALCNLKFLHPSLSIAGNAGPFECDF